MNILEVQNLCKTYGKEEAEVRALDHVSLSVGKGKFIAVAGEPGSTKGTLLNAVGALDNPTSGEVRIDGKNIFSIPEKKLTVFRRQNIGFIYQSFNLISELKVEQNITFHLKSMSVKYRQTILMIIHNEKHADATDRVLLMTDGRRKDLGVAAI
ncbi:MAG: ATP-binding cassette domain-containing protein [Lachnospiraceae bacterium]|nr:ATP-binding cassette domain-containing protein [Lachnospiraceae bacterium]